MHFVTGGAFQGKRNWVKAHYQLQNRTDYQFHSCYEKSRMVKPKDLVGSDLFIFEGIEQVIKDGIGLGTERARQQWYDFFLEWNRWEQQKEERSVILIGCDISKGIVPLEQSERLWRDITGWCYQDLTQLATRVDIIWSGLAQTIKGEI